MRFLFDILAYNPLFGANRIEPTAKTDKQMTIHGPVGIFSKLKEISTPRIPEIIAKIEDNTNIDFNRSVQNLAEDEGVTSKAAIRTIPTIFDAFNVREILADLIGHFDQVELTKENFVETLHETTTSIKLENFFLLEQSIFDILNEFSMIEALSKKCIITLNSENLSKLFR